MANNTNNTDNTNNTENVAGFVRQFTGSTQSLNNILRKLENEISNLNDISDETRQRLNNNITEFRNGSQGAGQSLLNSLNTLISSMIQVQANNEFANRISENTIENVREQNNLFNQEIANKRRMTEINTYYSNRNTQINFIMRNLVIILVVVIIITVLSKKGIIPKNIAHFSTVIAVLGIIIYIIYNVYDLSIRDRFNFAQYKIPFSEESRRAGTTEQSRNTRLDNLRDIIRNKLRDNLNFNGTCIGNDCCMPGTIYDIDRNVCIKDCPPNLEYNIGVDNQGNEVGRCDPI